MFKYETDSNTDVEGDDLDNDEGDEEKRTWITLLDLIFCYVYDLFIFYYYAVHAISLMKLL